ncbi:MAG: hypothetical protein N3D15_03325 [Syntrophorhabdaceae bacterium]|nr:hypothetical protein [Syntrophorhabdaceae bacterium]
MDSIYALRNRHYLILKKTLPTMIVLSAGFWCVFELLNLRIQNWFYINLPKEYYHRYLGYLLAYGTVIPAIYVTKEIIKTLIGGIKVKSLHLKRYPLYAILLGSVTLLLTLIIPEYFFGLAWVSIGLIFDGYNYYKGYNSFGRDLESGHLEDIIAAMLSGLFCGILWEFWNFWAITKWIYTVPFFENMKLFEMPILGYIGFVVFGLETTAFLNLLNGIWSRKIYVLAITIIMACICVITFALIDRFTVFSHLARVDELFFLSEDKRETLTREGIKTSYRIDIKNLDEKERGYIDLLHLKGLGLINLKQLSQYKIENIDGLSAIDEKSLSSILKEENLRRVRVFIKAAKTKVMAK